MEKVYNNSQKLSEINVGKLAKVNGLNSNGVIRERMLALGLTRGTTVKVIQRGPSGDPTIYDIRGAMIALRREEASLINVSLA
ncbi:ferrous iron transport protein A [Clostridium botulinum]|uniref:Iron transporter FeoA n=1 Tax=Clostridium botulinum C/D str. DC5 TaxID=1443128 RepID=A0A0A0IP34_CLOBO|nr:FeoA family protein [Clostridium botulinum]KEI01544.1 iron transporter FeoA [Clostridium botulinum C/D str. BKT75002]KEI07878.1 iron transporter FeoA [Clostridium botulinum C/D str. BKT2873]KGM95485.1 iron transporter FeoA [Clostridium botulinum D str. CCUG 7971]KGN01226.1 iron transporter FeoA [Clostridium botulinum C/D str. DC5]KOC46806.1 iron transporter FeoA [Clostridium botulinum]